MPGRLADEVVIVTGAGSGIGRATVRRLVAEGARVAATDVQVAAAEETVRLAHADVQDTGRAVALAGDVTSVSAIRAMVRDTEAALGPVTVLVNNAGWDWIAPFVDTHEEVWDRVLAINLKGQIACAHAVLPGMIERQRGRIICMASDAGRVGSAGEVVYSAAKGGVIAFVKALAREVARYKINVNAVAPGPVDTPFLKAFTERPGSENIVEAMIKATPMRRLARPEEIAGAVAYLASADTEFMTGQTLSINGGLTMI